MKHFFSFLAAVLVIYCVSAYVLYVPPAAEALPSNPVIERNRIWNSWVDSSHTSFDLLHDVQAYLATHAGEQRVQILDVQVVLALDKAIKLRESETEMLKKLRKELVK